MNSNTFLLMFGLNPDEFEPCNEGLIKGDDCYSNFQRFRKRCLLMYLYNK